MLKNLVGRSPSSERAGKSPRAAARKLRAVVESLEGRTMMSAAVSGVADRVRPIPTEVTKVTSSRVASNLASTDVSSPIQKITTLDFDTPLANKISELLKPTAPNDKEIDARKALLLNLALVNYEHLLKKYTSDMTAYRLTDTDASVYKTKKGHMPPDYFDMTTLKDLSPPATSGDYAGITYYNYKQPLLAPNAAQFWVDFANMKLGGGVFDTGFLQEETMFLETPELANAATQSSSLATRTVGRGPLNGNPTPLIFMGANRVMDIKPVLSQKPNKDDPPDKEYWRTYSIAKLIENDVPLTKEEPINVLSMAAPYLPPNSGPVDQTTPAVVDDLFNTFDAGFTLTVDVSQAEFPGKQPILINTGPIGAGGFHNNKAVVDVMQQLAAIVVSQQTGTQVNLKFWAYNDQYQGRNDDADRAVRGIIKEFNGGPKKTISELLTIAQKIARNVAVSYPNKP